MPEIKNCAGETYPVFATGKVNGCSIVQSAVPYGSVWYLKAALSSTATLLRLHPPYQAYLGQRPPCG